MLMNRTINSVAKPVFKPVIKFFPERFALLPAVGKISVVLPTGQQFFMVNNGRDGVVNLIYWLGGIGKYEFPSTKIWMLLTKNSKIVFDIGAFSGLYSLLAASLNEKTQIFAFEPVDETYSVLKQNIKVNNFKNIAAIKKAVSDSNGKVTLYIPHSALLPGSSSIVDKFRPLSFKKLEVSSISIDSFIKERNISRVDLVKIDVETAEPKVLKGMQQAIVNYHPTVLMEILPHRRNMEEFLENFFNSYGYIWFWLNNQGLVEQKHIRGDPTYKFSNYLFVKNKVWKEHDLFRKINSLFKYK
ncbi:FkbM family methyltransferase [Patescibacteria group bacterium]|nr:FkbM family methyltransferase [Patescibacteria group bacterium]